MLGISDTESNLMLVVFEISPKWTSSFYPLPQFTSSFEFPSVSITYLVKFNIVLLYQVLSGTSRRNCMLSYPTSVKMALCLYSSVTSTSRQRS